jgi:hypothetical protein
MARRREATIAATLDGRTVRPPRPAAPRLAMSSARSFPATPLCPRTKRNIPKDRAHSPRVPSCGCSFCRATIDLLLDLLGRHVSARSLASVVTYRRPDHFEISWISEQRRLEPHSRSKRNEKHTQDFTNLLFLFRPSTLLPFLSIQNLKSRHVMTWKQSRFPTISNKYLPQ